MMSGRWRPWQSSRDASTIRNVLQEVIRRIAAAVDPEEVFLFGSTVRGRFRRHSDLDLVVIKAGIYSDDDRRRIIQKINANLFGLRVPVDVIVVSPEDAREAMGNAWTFLGRALRAGRRVYRRTPVGPARPAPAAGNGNGNGNGNGRPRMSLSDWHQRRFSSMRRVPPR